MAMVDVGTSGLGEFGLGWGFLQKLAQSTVSGGFDPRCATAGLALILNFTHHAVSVPAPRLTQTRHPA
jgi:hypothetical protein